MMIDSQCTFYYLSVSLCDNVSITISENKTRDLFEPPACSTSQQYSDARRDCCTTCNFWKLTDESWCHAPESRLPSAFSIIRPYSWLQPITVPSHPKQIKPSQPDQGLRRLPVLPAWRERRPFLASLNQTENRLWVGASAGKTERLRK